MNQLLFVMTVAFMTHVIYSVFRTAAETRTLVPAAPVAEPVAPPVMVETAPVVAPEPAPAAPPVVVATPAPSKPAPTSKPIPARPAPQGDRGQQLRNPATGETSAVPANYRFAKKWIKDALVAEGLLDRVYKPNELDDATSRKIKEAIEQLRLLDKYQA